MLPDKQLQAYRLLLVRVDVLVSDGKQDSRSVVELCTL